MDIQKLTILARRLKSLYYSHECSTDELATALETVLEEMKKTIYAVEELKKTEVRMACAINELKRNGITH